jgi:hypothetical protein
MTEQELAELPLHLWMQSRIPALDALAAFVPTGSESDPVIAETQKHISNSRWYTVSGGHRVLFPYEGGEYDSSRFTIESRAWDHEHCKACGEIIPAMTLCWVTKSGPCIFLCSDCYERHVISKQPTRPWWKFW